MPDDFDFDTIHNQFDHAVSRLRMHNRVQASRIAELEGREAGLRQRVDALVAENAMLRAAQRPREIPGRFGPPMPAPWAPPDWARPKWTPDAPIVTSYPVEQSPLGPNHWMHETGDSTKRPRGEFRHTDDEE